jgi:hypothetical protein
VADAIRSYLINLGFKLDEPGLRKFNEQIVKTHHVVRDFSIAFAGFAIGIEEAIRRTARQFENLFYLSQQTGISVSNLKSINFAVGQIGLSASAVDQAISSMTLSLIKNPGLVGFVNTYVPGFKDAEEATEGLARHLRGLIDNFGRYSPQVAQFANTIEAMGADFGMVFQRALNVKEFDAWKQRSKEVLQTLLPIGKTADTIAKQAVDALNEWRFTWHITDVGLERIISATFPAFIRILQTFNTWLMKGETVEAFEKIAKSIEDWLKNEDNLKSIESILRDIGEGALAVARGLGKLFTANNAENLTTTLKSVADLTKDISESLKWIIERWTQAARLLTAGLPQPSTVEPTDEARRRYEQQNKKPFPGQSGQGAYQDQPREGESIGMYGLRQTWQWFKDFIEKQKNDYQNAPSGTGRPDEVLGPNPKAPGARKSSFGGEEGGVTSLGEALFNMFGAWFKGDTAFRPIVVIADEYYQKLVDALRNMTGITKAEGGAGAGGEGGSGGGIGGGGYVKSRGYGASTAGGNASVPTLTGGSGVRARIQQGMDYFVSQGWSKEQAAGIMSNLYLESARTLSTTIPGDSGQAVGIGQWHPDRQANFRRVFGKDIRQATYAEQLAFVQWELKNTESAAGNRLKNATTARQSGGDVSQFYERPRDVSGNRSARGALAEELLKNYAPGGTVAGTTNTGSGRGGARTSSIDAAIGDSIAVGLASAAGVPSDAIGGTTPKQIYDRVIKHVKDYAGQTVALGSGSNDPSQLEYVNETMKELHKVGAKVVLLGVGSGIRNYKKVNERLGEYAKKFGDPFTDELEGTEGGRVHPRSYKSTLDQVHRALGTERRQPLGTEGGRSSRVNNIDSDYNVNINVHGASDPHGTARQVQESMDRRSMLHSRNLRTSIA